MTIKKQKITEKTINNKDSDIKKGKNVNKACLQFECSQKIRDEKTNIDNEVMDTVTILPFPSKGNNKQKFVEQLQVICSQALQDGSLNHALKAQEMIGKAEGYFSVEKVAGKLTLKECSDEDIDTLIEELRIANT